MIPLDPKKLPDGLFAADPEHSIRVLKVLLEGWLLLNRITATFILIDQDRQQLGELLFLKRQAILFSPGAESSLVNRSRSSSVRMT